MASKKFGYPTRILDMVRGGVVGDENSASTTRIDVVKRCVHSPFFRARSRISGTALDDIEKGNKQVREVVKYITKRGAKAYGIRTGYGTWVYKIEAMSYSTQLALTNID
jgi:histidine ammonia-lyase